MKQVKELTDQYNSVMENMRIAIEELLPDGERFELEENGFEDDSSNDIEAVDNENVYMVGGDSYSLHELSFWDGITIIETIQKMQLNPAKP